MKKSPFLVFSRYMPAAALAFVLILAGCDNGATNGDGGGNNGNVEAGNLSGSTWERRNTSTAGYGWDFTYTYRFTSGSSGKYIYKGWGGTSSGKKNYNEETDFTYIYDGVVNMIGVITMSGSQKPFSISSDYKTLTVSGQTYTRK